MLFLVHALTFAKAIRCQTSPNYSYFKYGKYDNNVELDFSGEAGLLYRMSSALLFWENDAESCLAADMIPSNTEAWDGRGSLSLLWPFFQSLCFGQFVETLSCALQGRPLMTETGMSIFEHSLAFAEAEGMLSNSLGLSPFGSPRTGSRPKASAQGSDIINRNALFYKLNTPPEVLLLALISALNNLSSQILGVFNKQSRFRLVNTGIWGICFMSAFLWGFVNLRPESGPENILLRIPTVCIVGFIPHLLILVGMVLCATIYSLALLLSFLSPPTESVRPRTLRERFQMARNNMQANSQLSSIRLDMQEDFYTALLKIGFSALTVASEVVYLNEGKRISVAPLTWLEEDRLKELEEFHDVGDPTRTLSVQIEDVGNTSGPSGAQPTKWKSGYALQTSFKVNKMGPKASMQRADGVGHLQRGGRYFMAYEYFEGIFWLFVGWLRLLTNKTLDKVGIARRPGWLRQDRDKGVSEQQREAANISQAGRKLLDFWMLSEDGVLSLPENDDIDVAQETRKRLASANDWRNVDDEEALDTALYDWWKNNGWWGEKDDSGSYQPSRAGDSDDEDDATSVLSSTTASEITSDDDDRMELASGRSTPTQETYGHRRRGRRSPSSNHTVTAGSTFTDHALDPQHLAALLNPATANDRQEAQLLSHHLLSPHITTRSSYARARSTRAAKLLTSSRLRPAHPNIPAVGPLSREQEAQLLEQLLLEARNRRSRQSAAADGSGFGSGAGETSWSDGGDGQGSGGPQCVVCQSEPRTVLAWPCRCLSLCEECRVSLAMNNFATCVCCRREVVGFSRLYVP